MTSWDGRSYQQRFDRLAASGADVHGEADLVASLVPAGATILDAGCGTGRVAMRLTELGYDCVGVDADASMIDEARRRDPTGEYHHTDLADLDLDRRFDAVVLAGNVVPLVGGQHLSTALRRLAGHLLADGLLVAGFGLDPAHLPPGCPVTGTDRFDEACRGAGLTPTERFATWSRDPWSTDSGYIVALCRPAG